MTDYDEILFRNRLLAISARSAAAAAAEEESIQLDAAMGALRSHYTAHALPEFAAALAAIQHAGGTATIEIAEVFLNTTRFGTLRISLTVAQVRYAFEITGHSLEQSLACRIQTPTSDTALGTLAPGGDLREFARTHLSTFLSQITL
jgi:hypothetical protein